MRQLGKKGLLKTHPNTVYHKFAVKGFNAMRIDSTIDSVIQAEKMKSRKQPSLNRKALKKLLKLFIPAALKTSLLEDPMTLGRLNV